MKNILFILFSIFLFSLTNTNGQVLFNLLERLVVETGKDCFTVGENVEMAISFDNQIQLSKFGYLEILGIQNETVYKSTFELNRIPYLTLFRVDEKLPTGIYTLIVYTNLQRNLSPELLFKKKILILNTGVVSQYSLDTTMYKNKDFYKIKVFPEGGMLSYGLENCIKVSVTNRHGLVQSGNISLKNEGAIIQTIPLDNVGVGEFRFVPQMDNYQLVFSPYSDLTITLPLDSFFNSGYSFSQLNYEPGGVSFLYRSIADVKGSLNTDVLVDGKLTKYEIQPVFNTVKKIFIPITANTNNVFITVYDGDGVLLKFWELKNPEGFSNNALEPNIIDDSIIAGEKYSMVVQNSNMGSQYLISVFPTVADSLFRLVLKGDFCFPECQSISNLILTNLNGLFDDTLSVFFPPESNYRFVTGKVLNQQGLPLQNTAINLSLKSNVFDAYRTVSDPNGMFVFPIQRLLNNSIQYFSVDGNLATILPNNLFYQPIINETPPPCILMKAILNSLIV